MEKAILQREAGAEGQTPEKQQGKKGFMGGQVAQPRDPADWWRSPAFPATGRQGALTINTYYFVQI